MTIRESDSVGFSKNVRVYSAYPITEISVPATYEKHALVIKWLHDQIFVLDGYLSICTYIIHTRMHIYVHMSKKACVFNSSIDQESKPCACALSHWGLDSHICVNKLTIICLNNGLSPSWRQAIIWTSACILLVGTLGTNFSEMLIGIDIFSFRLSVWNISSTK